MANAVSVKIISVRFFFLALLQKPVVILKPGWVGELLAGQKEKLISQSSSRALNRSCWINLFLNQLDLSLISPHQLSTVLCFLCIKHSFSSLDTPPSALCVCVLWMFLFRTEGASLLPEQTEMPSSDSRFVVFHLLSVDRERVIA